MIHHCNEQIGEMTVESRKWARFQRTITHISLHRNTRHKNRCIASPKTFTAAAADPRRYSTPDCSRLISLTTKLMLLVGFVARFSNGNNGGASLDVASLSHITQKSAMQESLGRHQGGHLHLAKVFKIREARVEAVSRRAPGNRPRLGSTEQGTSMPLGQKRW